MRITYCKRAVYYNTSWFGIHRNRCSCSGHGCGKDIRTTGYSFYFGTHIVSVCFDRPKGCDSIF